MHNILNGIKIAEVEILNRICIIGTGLRNLFVFNSVMLIKCCYLTRLVFWFLFYKSQLKSSQVSGVILAHCQYLKFFCKLCYGLFFPIKFT